MLFHTELWQLFLCFVDILCVGIEGIVIIGIIAVIFRCFQWCLAESEGNLAQIYRHRSQILIENILWIHPHDQNVDKSLHKFGHLMKSAHIEYSIVYQRVWNRAVRNCSCMLCYLRPHSKFKAHHIKLLGRMFNYACNVEENSQRQTIEFQCKRKPMLACTLHITHTHAHSMQ